MKTDSFIGAALSGEPPAFTTEEAARLAADWYGIRGVAAVLPSYMDQNFLIQTKDSCYVLKVSNARTDMAELDLQVAALQFLATRRSDCPRVVMATDGQPVVVAHRARGACHRIWMISFLEGRPLGEVRPSAMPHLLEGLGTVLGSLDRDLADFRHPHASRSLPWDLLRAPELQDLVPFVTGAERRALAARCLDHYEVSVLPRLWPMRRGVIHNDANDQNILVEQAGYQSRISGIVDFGDMVHTSLICEVAIAATYVMMNKADPVGAAVHVIRGYHQAFPLLEEEIAQLYDLVLARLCSSVLVSAYRGRSQPDNRYLKISEAPAWQLLARLSAESRSLATYRFREACNFDICPASTRVVGWLKRQAGTFAPVVQQAPNRKVPLVLDFSVASPELGSPAQDPVSASQALFAQLKRKGASIGVGRYNEARLIYGSDQFRHPHNEYNERRTIHLGIDLFQAAGSPVFAPMEGTVHVARQCNLPLDFGGLVVLRHEAEGDTFYTLYGHLSHKSVDALVPGMPVLKGQAFGALGTIKENGGWIPHLHFQLFADLFDDAATDVCLGVAPASQRAVWLAICPDPNLILRIPEHYFRELPRRWTAAQVRRSRAHHVGANLSVSYREPLHIVRGLAQHLYDAEGRAYLDAVNNVPHVGHCHPRVVRAAQRQQLVLNTNTRYLHASLVQYAQRLVATMPDPLSVCFFVNSGSEANDLALRLARAHTLATGMVVLDGAYHGHLTSLIAISPYKFAGPGGEGAPPHVQMALAPDPYRGKYRGSQAALQYAKSVRDAIDRLEHPLCAFICESLLGCGGQVEFPEGYLQAVYTLVRQAGGVCIADEVQVGFGRVGSHFWGFQTQDVVPDIVVLGKPMGNGHPLAGVVTTRAIADSFNNGMEFFSTFGGNPVSCAVGMAVLDVLRDENLQDHAFRTGNHLKARLHALGEAHAAVGDVRGRGLFLGVELVLDRALRTPAKAQAAYVANRMRERGVLISTDGPWGNVLKIKPPLVFNTKDADRLVETLDEILSEDFVALSSRDGA